MSIWHWVLIAVGLQVLIFVIRLIPSMRTRGAIERQAAAAGLELKAMYRGERWAHPFLNVPRGGASRVFRCTTTNQHGVEQYVWAIGECPLLGGAPNVRWNPSLDQAASAAEPIEAIAMEASAAVVPLKPTPLDKLQEL